MRLVSMLVCLLALSCGAAVAESQPTDVTKLSPVPQVSLAVPQGWSICDEGTGIVSENDVSDTGSEKARCHAIPSAQLVLMFNRNAGRSGIVVLAMHADPVFEPGSLGLLTPELIKGIEALTCSKSAELLSYAPEHCRLALGQLHAGPALVGDATGRLTVSGVEVHVRLVEVSYTGGTMLLFAERGADDEEADIDTIINSIAVN